MAVEKPYDGENAGVTGAGLKFCDLRCPHARTPDKEGLDGSCRTFQALWCEKLSRHVVKNAPCEERFGARRPTTGF